MRGKRDAKMKATDYNEIAAMARFSCDADSDFRRDVKLVVNTCVDEILRESCDAFADTSASSEGWHVQRESNPPGKKLATP